MIRDTMPDLRKIIATAQLWSWETRGETIDIAKRQEGLVAHMRKEVAEIQADPSDLVEYADVFLLATDSALRAAAWPHGPKRFHHIELMTLFTMFDPVTHYMEFEDIYELLVKIEESPDADTVPAMVMGWAREMAFRACPAYLAFNDTVVRKQDIVRQRKYPPFVEGKPLEHIRDAA